MKEKENKNGVATAGFVCALISCISMGLMSIIALILSIAGLKKAKKQNGYKKGKAVAGIIISSVTFVIAIVTLVFVLFVFNKQATNGVKPKPTTHEVSEWKVPKGTAGKVYIFQDKEYKTLAIATDEDLTQTYLNSDDMELKYTYKCNDSSCMGEGLYEDLGYALIKDGDYVLYDYEKNLYKEIIIKGISYDYIRPIYYDGKIYGYTVSKEDNSTAIYNEQLGKLVTDFKYSSSKYGHNGASPEVYDGNLIVSKDIKGDDANDKFIQYLIDFKTGKEKYTNEQSIDYYIDGGYYLSAIGNKGNVYYIKDYGFEVSDSKICDETLEPIIDGKYSNYGINSKGNIIVGVDNKFSIYNNKGNLVKNSKEYKQIIAIGNDYIAVVDNDNYIKVVDYDGKVVAKFVEVTDDIEIHDMLSGWWNANGKEGMYVVVEDSSIEEGTLGRGAEYYYEPKTKKQGVIKLEEIGGYAKPVLYLYPTHNNTKVDITFGNDKVLKTTYPKYNGKWSVTANKNGDLIDKDGKKYYALYWDETTYKKVSFKEGFYVTKDNVISFLEEKLDLIGLNYKEKNEFIMYWLPILESNGKSLVYFELTNSREAFNKLNINPKPDSLLRVAIHIKKVNQRVNIKGQKLPKFIRKGFTAVEWGGVNY